MIGNKQGNPKPDVVLAALGIMPNHAFVSFDSDENKCFLEVLDENSANYTYINGTQTTSINIKEELFHLDRIIFGTGCVFILMFKNSQPRAEKPVLADIDYQFAIEEMHSVNSDKYASHVDLEKKIMVE